MNIVIPIKNDDIENKDCEDKDCFDHMFNLLVHLKGYKCQYQFFEIEYI
jgi:hypothetical protein